MLQRDQFKMVVLKARKGQTDKINGSNLIIIFRAHQKGCLANGFKNNPKVNFRLSRSSHEGCS